MGITFSRGSRSTKESCLGQERSEEVVAVKDPLEILSSNEMGNNGSCNSRSSNSVGANHRVPEIRALVAENDGNIPYKSSYDFNVFLNHRGPDVKGTFAAHLEDALLCAGFHPFLDKNALKKGDHALKVIDQALKASDVHVAIVSTRYAESKYCLNELVAMLGSGKPIIPVFYGVEPHHLRHELLSGPFGPAFQKYKERGGEKDIKQWVDALDNLSEITAFRLADYNGDEAKLKHDVVNEVKRYLPSNFLLPVGKYRVGLRQSIFCCIKELEKMGPKTGALSLTGMGGVGKTTLSQEIYNYYAVNKKYQSMTFLRDIRSAFLDVQVGTKGHVELQNQLLRDLLRVEKTSRDYNYWFQQLSRLGPIFIVLDNIDSKDQFEQLIPDMNLLGQGSRIILTSRHKNLSSVIPREFLTCQHVVKPLGSSASQKLFNLHTFGKEEVPEEFQDLATKVANACYGLPLGLKVLGSSLAGKTTMEDRQTIWLEAVEYLKENVDVMRVLQWSFNCLPSKSEKIMFQDIACIIHRIEKRSALACWEACKHCTLCPGFRTPHTSLQCLMDRCLVEEDRQRCLIVHDLLRDMAKNTVREQIEEPRRHSHQFDVHVAERIITRNEGTKNIRGLALVGSRKRKFDAEGFRKMKQLHYLVLDGCDVTGDLKRFPKSLRYLQWRAMPHSQIPPALDLSSLAVLDLSESNDLAVLWSNSNPPMQHFSHLRALKMSSCFSITELPASLGAISMLDQLDLRDCQRLKFLPQSTGQLKKLDTLILSGCKNLELLPSSIGELTSLQRMEMSECQQLRILPDSLGNLPGLLSLTLINSSLTELPHTLGFLSNLESLDLTGSSHLQSLPNTFCNLTSLREIELSSTSIQELPSFLEQLCNLDFLGLDNCNLDIECPTSFSGNPGLKILSLRLNTVECLPEIVKHLPHLEEVFLSEDFEEFSDVPEEFMVEPDVGGVVLRKKTHFLLETDTTLPTD